MNKTLYDNNHTRHNCILDTTNYGIFVFIYRVNRGYVHFYLNFTIYAIYLLVLQLYAYVMPKIKTNVLDNVRSCPLPLNDSMLADPAVVNTYKEVKCLK